MRDVAPPSLAGRRVLVVEDNSYNQLVARELLESAGLVVDIAENGREAVECVLFGVVAYDAVLMDVQMPIMDGWAATRELRGHERGRALPIIGMTAYTMIEDIERCREAGMDDVVTKPVRLDKVLEVLAARLSDAAAAPAARMESVPQTDTELIDIPGALGRLGNNRELLHRLLRDFCEKETGTAEKLQTMIAAGSVEEADRLVHTVKGTAMILGLDRLTAAAAALEADLRRQDKTGYEKRCAPFAAELEKAIAVCGELAGAAPAQDAPPAADAIVVPPEALQALLGEFAALLERNHMDALKLVPRLHELLRGTSDGAAVEEVRNCLDNLDFKGARRHFGSISPAQKE